MRYRLPTLDRGAGGLACLLVLTIILIATATARAEGLKAVCASAAEKTVECMSFEISGVVSFEGSGEKGGLDPENLRSAYKLPESGGSGQTVAIVDAYNDPNAEANLKTYRSHYGLSECTTANGCFKRVNQKGETSGYPENESAWSTEMSLDLDMVSAVCSGCHILLVEATSNSYTNMEAAENEAATLKATVISDSWGGPERSGETSENSAFEHAGIPIMVSAGDYCYIDECESGSLANFPAVVPSVVAVGGTELKKAANSRGWSESVWFEPKSEYGEIGTGSGCSLYETKPSWQTDKSCSKRTDNDVAAVAACKSPLSIYDSYEREGWFVECGTSAAAPILAGIEALSSSGARKEGGELFSKLGSKEKLFDVTEGENYTTADKSCGSYLCEAKVGYDGPTGWGTPDGVFTSAPTATTGSATAITASEATLHGTVNPEGAETKYYFEYGTTESYGSKTTEASAGSGMSNVEESKTITGLAANTKYHYRIVATNSNGTTDGADQSFSTTTAWSFQEPPNPTGSKESGLNGVSCRSSTECMAVGEFENSSGKFVPLAEKWNGTAWSVEEPPVPAGAKLTQLWDVSCTSSTACMAVGDVENSAEKTVSLAEKWNGTTWTSQEPALPTEATWGVLTGISCTSSTECVAAGSFSNSSEEEFPLAEKWNGTAWTSQEPPPPAGVKHSQLHNVSCTSSAACIAVGFFESSEKDVPLAEKWNGTAWSAQEPPTLKEARYSSLIDVSCTSSSECIAVGESETNTFKILPLAEKWNGTTWSTQEPPFPTGGKEGHLLGVSCTSSTACTAIGWFENSSEKFMPLTEKWNGTAWSALEPPMPTGAKRGTLEGLSCTSSTECFATGSFENSSSVYSSLVERYL
ncbi:MAG TPA: hypothetical protein VGP18_07965 [Solirubrobacteraceae bacterium]|jgi:hypothetical protein|nr:hypothetical protein [Solirubrobacteraceae bacterium]